MHKLEVAFFCWKTCEPLGAQVLGNGQGARSYWSTVEVSKREGQVWFARETLVDLEISQIAFPNVQTRHLREDRQEPHTHTRRVANCSALLGGL